MNLKEFALMLREELLKSNDTEAIVKRIKNAKIGNRSFNSKEIETILMYMEYPEYNPETGFVQINESDNSEYIKLINIIREKTKNDK